MLTCSAALNRGIFSMGTPTCYCTEATAQKVDFISSAKYIGQEDGSTSLSIQSIANSRGIWERNRGITNALDYKRTTR